MAQRQEDEEIQADIDDYEAIKRGYDHGKVDYYIDDDYEAVQSGYVKWFIREYYCQIKRRRVNFFWVTPVYDQTNILLEKKREKKATKTFSSKVQQSKKKKVLGEIQSEENFF